MGRFGSVRALFGAQPSALLTDAAVLAYALWTIAAHGVVIGGGDARALAVGLFAAIAAFVFVCVWIARSAGRLAAYRADVEADPVMDIGRAKGLRAAALALPVAGAVSYLATQDALLAYALAAAAALAGAVYALRASRDAGAGESANEPASATTGSQRAALVLLAVACAALTLCAVRPRSDDTLYLNLAVSVVDHAHAPMLRDNWLHGPNSVLLPDRVFPPYRVHSFELLGGVLAYLSGKDPIAIIHLGLAAVFALVTPFAAARLLRVLAPRSWLVATCVLIAFYFVDGSAGRGYANHALVRMFNGKAVLLTVLLPLICAYGLRLGARPTRSRFALLALAQVAALGLSSTGLWLAPVLGVLSTVAGALDWRSWPKRIALAVLSATYVLVLGAWLFTQMRGSSAVAPDAISDERAAVTESALPEDATPPEGAAPSALAHASEGPAASGPFAALAAELPIVLGPRDSAVGLLLAAALAAPLATSALGARLFGCLGLFVALFLANPWLSGVVTSYVTGAAAYHRVMWALPIPYAVALCASAIFERSRAALTARPTLGPTLRSALAFAVMLAALIAFTAFSVERFLVSDANGTTLIFPPALKLAPLNRKVALDVCQRAGTGTHILGSLQLMQQLPIVPGCGAPLFTDPRWVAGPAEESAARAELAAYMGSRDVPVTRARWFYDAIERYAPKVAVVTREGARNVRTKSLLRLAGYERAASKLQWDLIYVRGDARGRQKRERIASDACRVLAPGSVVLAPFALSSGLSAQGCVRAVAVPAALDASAASIDQLFLLERMVQFGDPLPGGSASLDRALRERSVEAVVFSRTAKGQRDLLEELQALGFRRRGGITDHVVLERAGPL
jgi:hypothetical protein